MRRVIRGLNAKTKVLRHFEMHCNSGFVCVDSGVKNTTVQFRRCVAGGYRSVGISQFIRLQIEAMADTFDAYHKWLGITPSQQPATHYRLLGIEAFESDADVIEAAANQRMSYLQDFTTGPHVATAQKILNEIAAVRRCLLNAEKKAAYDETLNPSIAVTDSDSAEEEPTQEPSSLVTWIVSGVVLTTVLSIAAYFFVISGDGGDGNGGDDGPATLVIDWPLDERDGADIEIGGKQKQLPADRRIEFNLPLGRPEVVFTRDGYQEIRRGIRFTEDPVKLRLNWRPLANE